MRITHFPPLVVPEMVTKLQVALYKSHLPSGTIFAYRYSHLLSLPIILLLTLGLFSSSSIKSLYKHGLFSIFYNLYLLILIILLFQITASVLIFPFTTGLGALTCFYQLYFWICCLSRLQRFEGHFSVLSAGFSVLSK